MDTDDIEMGPIDYVLVEWPGKQPEGEIAPHLVDLVDRGLIRILDLAFLAKGDGKSTAALEHRRLADADEAVRMKTYWRQGVAALKDLLER